MACGPDGQCLKEFSPLVEQFDLVLFKTFDPGFCITDSADFGDENVRFTTSKGGVYSNVTHEFEQARKVRVEVAHHGL